MTVEKSEEEAYEIFIKQGFSKKAWPTKKAPDDWFYVGNSWLFFSVRGDKQCLQFKDDKDKLLLREQKRIEIFAPRLKDILDSKKGSDKAIGINKKNLVIISLNPSATTFFEMIGKPNDKRKQAVDELKQAVFYGITKRTELQKKPVDLPDTLKRVRRLNEEIKAWIDLEKVSVSYLEFTSWKHLEYRYMQPDNHLSNIRRELLVARETLLNQLDKEAQNNSTIRAFLDSKAIHAVGEILDLTEIM